MSINVSVKGEFVNVDGVDGGTNWVESNNRGNYNFKEVNREQSSVTLKDESRNMTIRIDLGKRKIFSDPYGRNSVLYYIISSKDRPAENVPPPRTTAPPPPPPKSTSPAPSNTPVTPTPRPHPSPAPPSRPTEEVGVKIVAFENIDFGGASLEITGSMAYVGNDWNDRISSVKIPSEYKIVIYENSNFSGKYLILEGNQNCNSFWNDKVSSVKVMRKSDITSPGTTPATTINGNITVFEHNNFSGASKVFTEDVAWVGNDWNDRISSINIPEVINPRPRS